MSWFSGDALTKGFGTGRRFGPGRRFGTAGKFGAAGKLGTAAKLGTAKEFCLCAAAFVPWVGPASCTSLQLVALSVSSTGY